MKTIKIPGKKVLDVLKLEKELRDAGFLLIGAVACVGSAPYVHVHLEDAEEKRPEDIVNAHVNPFFITVVTDKAAGVSGLPEALADGSDKHTLTVSKIDPDTGLVAPGSENLQIIPDRAIQVSQTERQFANGVARLTIGPSKVAGPISVRIVDNDESLIPGAIILRFV